MHLGLAAGSAPASCYAALQPIPMADSKAIALVMAIAFK
jgi:hypothetical protein